MGGVRSYGRFAGHRKIRTTNERRQMSWHDEDEPPYRGRRRCIPNYWDDLIRIRQRTWKKTSRRNQWRPK